MPAHKGWKRLLARVLLPLITLGLTAFGLEIGLRVRRGSLFTAENIAHRTPAIPFANYDPELGWIPRTGFTKMPDYDLTVDEARLRSNGRSHPSGSAPILVFGDSFTFGNDVHDNETWPSELETILQQPVLNAAVTGYGIDQAFMRAEKLLPNYHPAVVIVAFISHDVHRAELSYYSKWKPYFEYGSNGLELKNVPVPKGFAVPRSLPTLNRILGHSFLAEAIFKRTKLRRWYQGPHTVQVHDKGVEVATELLTRLSGLAQQRGSRFVAVTLATDGRFDDTKKIEPTVERLKANHIEVFDLAGQMLQLPRDQFNGMFGPRGHYRPELNRWVATQVAAHLRGTKASTAN
ncbi:MAG TPA: hypothetical protein VJ719_15190 [Chthoniobacterales bacterium]|nr:hypothetical protein [Chthoniobacterales bacterium]